MRTAPECGADELLRCRNNGEEIRGLESRATDQATVNIGLSQQLRRIARIHAAAVKHRHASGLVAGCSQLRTQHGMNLLGLLGRGGLASAYGPDRLIGHHQLAHAWTDLVNHGCQLTLDHDFCLTGFTLRQGLAHADDGRNALTSAAWALAATTASVSP